MIDRNVRLMGWNIQNHSSSSTEFYLYIFLICTFVEIYVILLPAPLLKGIFWQFGKHVNSLSCRCLKRLTQLSYSLLFWAVSWRNYFFFNLPELLSKLHKTAHNKVCGLFWVTGSWFLERDITDEFFKNTESSQR